jgi:outer membrane scaffolding protein for murein synthesis (MipA/OmpV family)
MQTIYMIGWAPHDTQPQPKRRGSAKRSLKEIPITGGEITQPTTSSSSISSSSTDTSSDSSNSSVSSSSSNDSSRRQQDTLSYRGLDEPVISRVTGSGSAHQPAE